MADPIFGLFKFSPAQQDVSFDVLDWLSIAFTMLVNIVATTLIGWKAW